MTAVILVGMSVRDANDEHLLTELAARRSDTSVAFLQLGDPSLRSELSRRTETEQGRVIMVGASFAKATTARSWLRRVAAHWLRENSARAPQLVLAPDLLRVADGDRLDALIVAAESAGSEVTGQEAPLSSPGWEDVPGYRHQVFVCRGPRCSARGADATATALDAALAAAGLDNNDVLLTQTGCQFPCNHAPVVTVHPDDAWYGRVDVNVAAAIVTEHLIGGRRVETHLLPRTPQPRAAETYSPISNTAVHPMGDSPEGAS